MPAVSAYDTSDSPYTAGGRKPRLLIVINVPDFPRDLLPRVPTFPKDDPEDEMPTERPPARANEDAIRTELLPPPHGSVQEAIPTEAPPVSTPAASHTRRTGEDDEQGVDEDFESETG